MICSSYTPQFQHGLIVPEHFTKRRRALLAVSNDQDDMHVSLVKEPALCLDTPLNGYDSWKTHKHSPWNTELERWFAGMEWNCIMFLIIGYRCWFKGMCGKVPSISLWYWDSQVYNATPRAIQSCGTLWRLAIGVRGLGFIEHKGWCVCR